MQPSDNHNMSTATPTHCSGQEKVNCNVAVDSNEMTSMGTNQKETVEYSEEVSKKIDGKEKFANLFFHTTNPLSAYIIICFIISSIAILQKGGDCPSNQDVIGDSTTSPQMVENEGCDSRIRREVGV